jgi:hypothetical protein
MSRLAAGMPRLAVAALLLALGAAGCRGDSDACQGRAETCLSLTLLGSDGVSQADQLALLVQRQPLAQMPMVPLGEARPLPFKVAVLWPDGPGIISVRSLLGGQLTGVTAELTLDLRNGAHAKRQLTLYPPLLGSPLGDLGSSPRDLSAPSDMAKPSDLSTGTDLFPPADLSTATDMSAIPDQATAGDM